MGKANSGACACTACRLVYAACLQAEVDMQAYACRQLSFMLLQYTEFLQSSIKATFYDHRTS